MRHKNSHSTIEGFAIANLKKGATFYSSKSSAALTSWASKGGRLIKTQTTICVAERDLKATKIYKVTLLN